MRFVSLSLFLALALSVFVPGLFAQTLPQNLYYKFNEGTGTTTANDASPGVGSNPATLPTGATWFTPGQLGAAAINFSTSNALNTGWSAALTTTNSFTLEAWIRGDATTFGYLFYFQTTPNFRIFQNSNGTLSIASTGGTPSTNITTSAITANTWTHLALVYDAGASTFTVYFNGNVDSANARTCAVSGNLIIGSNSLTSAASAWRGQVDDFRFWTTARTQAEIQANMNSELSSTAPTLAPASGSSFNGALSLTQVINTPLSNATLRANDINTPNINMTVASSSPAPGVTAPTSQAGVAVPFNINWTGTPNTLGTFTYTVTLDDGTTQVPYVVTINVINPAPTLVPSTGSGFTAARVYSAMTGVPLSNASLTANDTNDPNINITVTAVSAAPGVTAPGSQAGATVPATLTWTGTPTTVGSFTYTVQLSDGTNSPSFNVTINVTNPAPTLVPASGSTFTAARVLTVIRGNAITTGTLSANDTNDPNINITVTAVSAAPGVTAPTSGVGVSVPSILAWTGTPTADGTYSYTVVLSDGVNSPSFNVTVTVVPPPFSGTYVVNKAGGAGVDYTDIGTLFDALETAGVSGPCTFEIYDDGGPYTVTASYSLGATGSTIKAVAGVSTTNTLTFRAAAGESPVISGNACPDTYTAATTGCMAFRNIGNITLQGLEFTGGNMFGVMWYASTTNSADNVNIIRCKFHGITQGAAIYMYGSGTTTGPNNVLIENNFCWDVTGNGSGNIGGGTGGGPCGVIGARRPGTQFRVRHNTVVFNSNNANCGVFYADNGSTVALADVSFNVVHLTSTSAVPFMFLGSTTATHLPTTADRNVVFLGGNATMCSNSATYGTWAQWQASGRDVNGVNGDPMLASTTSPFNLHVTAASPAIDLAVGSTTALDIDGQARPFGSASDSGADEAAPTAPVIISTAPTTATVGVNYTYTIVASGYPASSLFVSGNPAWLSLAGNVLSGTPGASDVGVTGVITLTANNGVAPNGIQQFQITVSNPSPSFTTSTLAAGVTSSWQYRHIVYTATLVNSGTGNSTNATMLIPVPSGASFVSGSLTTTGSAVNAVYNSGASRVEWGPANLNIGSNVVVTFRLRLDIASGNVSASGTIGDPAAIPVSTNLVAAAVTSNGNLPALAGTAGGYTVTDSFEPSGPTYTYTDATATGTPLGITADAATIVAVPFPVYLFGTSATQISVDHDGSIIFNTPTLVNPTYLNQDMKVGAQAWVIAPFWDDSNNAASGTTGVYTLVTGTAPNRKFIVEWKNMQHFSTSPSTVSFQVVFTENSTDIMFAYDDATFGDANDYGASATVGIRGAATTDVVQYSFNTATLADQMVIVFDGANIAPTITSSPVTTAVAGSNYTYTVVANGSPAPSIGVSGNPSWLTLSGNVLSGTPTAADIGVSGTITVTASNGTSPDATQMFQITVNGVAPSITSTPATTTVAGSLYSYTIVATGQPAPALSVVGNPSWLTLSGNVLSGTPTAADIGTTGTITITAANGQTPDATQPFQITVNGQPPSITSTAPTTATVGMLYSYTIVATGVPAPTLSSNTLPGWLTLSGNVLSGTPGIGDMGLSTQIDITAANGWTPDDVESFQIQVNGVAPIITSTAPTSALAGSLYTYTLSATGNPAPSFSVSGNPAWLTLAGNVLSGTPAVSDIGTTGMITITAANGQAPDDTEQFQITVTGTAPSITSSAPTAVVVGSLYSYTINATGVPAPTLSVSGNPAWLTLSGNVLSGTAPGSALGTVGPITITAANGVSPDDTEVFSINVTGVAPVITSAAVTTATAGSLYTYTVTFSGTPTPTISVTGLPSWLTFNAGTNTISGTPMPTDAGATGLITITVANTIAPNAVQSFVINVGTLGGGGGGGGAGGGGCSTDSSNSPWLLLIGFVAAALCGIRMRRSHP